MASSAAYGTLQVPEVFRALWPEVGSPGSIEPTATATLVVEQPASTDPWFPTLPIVVGGLLTVKEAATRLGVHENTIRNWAERGILKAVRLPGSGYRRMRAADVERVRQELLGQITSPIHASGSDIEPAPTSEKQDDDEGKQGLPHEGW